MKNINPYFPETDRVFLLQMEISISNGEQFRKNRNWSAYLKKLIAAKVNYVLIVGNKALYFDEYPADVRPESVIDLKNELDSLPKELLELAKPNIKVIRSKTAEALEKSGVPVHGKKIASGILKAERLYS